MLRKRLERWERWLRSHLRSRKTRHIEEEQQRYAQTYYDVQNFLDRLQTTNQQQRNVVEELKKRIGIYD